VLKIAFRVDASSQIGTGHIMRCLTLADALREKGAECQFICRDHEGHLMDHIRSRGYTVHALPKPEANASFEMDLAHSQWLSGSWQTDAEQTSQALGDIRLDWLIVDHYALDHHWESALRSSCNRIMVIDDLADRQHDCDLLLDQNYGSSAERYRGLVSADCAQHHGPEYALLKPVYAERRAQLPARGGQVRRVLIYFGGGADVANLTLLAVQAFQAPELAHIELDIVVGASYAQQSSLEELVTQRGKAATIHQQLPDLADLMAKADLAIGAGGATTWERCCMGLPSVLVVCALNQAKIGEAIGKLGAGVVLYPNKNFTAEAREQVVMLSNDSKKYLQMSHIAERVCDGLGVSRVTKQIISKSNPIAYDQ
jgi:UDP-2,4-diacetamido-2,4,6-trideoxy-beta-L-altropyranose hydrolase